MNEWKEVLKDGFPPRNGQYLCVVRGKTSICLMKYKSEDKSWRAMGASTLKVTHWFMIPSLPSAIRQNILLAKAREEELDIEEKIELSNLLREGTF